MDGGPMQGPFESLLRANQLVAQTGANHLNSNSKLHIADYRLKIKSKIWNLKSEIEFDSGRDDDQKGWERNHWEWFQMERGRVMEILRADDDLFLKFGQVYVTTTYPQVVKAWHYHKVQTESHRCPCKDDQSSSFMIRGRVLRRKGRSTNSLSGSIILCWSKCPTESIMGGSASVRRRPSSSTSHRRSMRTMNPNEYRLPPHGKDIPYDWSRKDG